MTTMTAQADRAKPLSADMTQQLLTMDVVDEIRHSNAQLAAHADTEEARVKLRNKLLRMYRDNPDVTPELIEAGIQATLDKRFTYVPAKGMQARLALAWINRRKHFLQLAWAIGIAAMASLAHQWLIVQPREQAIAADIDRINTELRSIPVHRTHVAELLDATRQQIETAVASAQNTPNSQRISAVIQERESTARLAVSEGLKLAQTPFATAPPSLLTRENYVDERPVHESALAERQQVVLSAREQLQIASNAVSDILTAGSINQSLTVAETRITGVGSPANLTQTFEEAVGALQAAEFVAAQALVQRINQGIAELSELEAYRVRVSKAMDRAARIASTMPDAVAAIATSQRAAIDAIDSQQAALAASATQDVENLVSYVGADIRYRLRNETGLPWGVRRKVDATGHINYYVVAHAIDGNGRRLSLPILSEEDSSVKVVDAFGIRVPHETYVDLRNDKGADGMFSEPVVGLKARGHLAPTFNLPVSGGYIHTWEEPK